MIPEPATLETGSKAYNVYPLAVTTMIWNDQDELVPETDPDPGKTAAFRDGPFVKVPAVQVPPKVAKSNQ